MLLQIAYGFGWIELEAHSGIGHSLAIAAILARRAMVCGGWRKAGQSLRALRCTPALRLRSGQALKSCHSGSGFPWNVGRGRGGSRGARMSTSQKSRYGVARLLASELPAEHCTAIRMVGF